MRRIQLALQCLTLAVVFTQIHQASPLHAAPTQITGTVVEALKARHASVYVWDVVTKKPVWTYGENRSGLPGSVIKPLLLHYALVHGIVQPKTSVYCRRTLIVGGRALACTHPPDQTTFTAETALAESCNTWFASMGRRFNTVQLIQAYASVGVPYSTPAPLTQAERELLVLGLAGPPLTLAQLAHAYSLLFAQLTPLDPVWQGLRGSVQYGMARAADLPGLEVLGKTGTASDPATYRTHGWFVGKGPGGVLVVVYVPEGDGGAAAQLAKLILRSLVR